MGLGVALAYRRLGAGVRGSRPGEDSLQAVAPAEIRGASFDVFKALACGSATGAAREASEKPRVGGAPMAKCLSATVIALMAVLAVLVQATQPAQATFHCMRIHAVMGGFNGSDAVQYVELRMNLSGQSFVQNRKARFYDGSGTLKAEFTFPATATVGNAFTGDSILIATAEYNAASAGPGSGGSGAAQPQGRPGPAPQQPEPAAVRQLDGVLPERNGERRQDGGLRGPRFG